MACCECDGTRKIVIFISVGVLLSSLGSLWGFGFEFDSGAGSDPRTTALRTIPCSLTMDNTGEYLIMVTSNPRLEFRQPGMPPWRYRIRHSLGLLTADCGNFSTDLQPAQQGPEIVLALLGLPREIVREVPPDQLANESATDLGNGNDPVWHSGADLLIQGLSARFSPLQVEAAIGSMTELVAFKRKPGESIDRANTRFELLRHKAGNLGNFNIGIPNLAWMLLNALSIPPTQWA